MVVCCRKHPTHSYVCLCGRLLHLWWSTKTSSRPAQRGDRLRGHVSQHVDQTSRELPAGLALHQDELLAITTRVVLQKKSWYIAYIAATKEVLRKRRCIAYDVPTRTENKLKSIRQVCLDPRKHTVHVQTRGEDRRLVWETPGRLTNSHCVPF